MIAIPENIVFKRVGDEIVLLNFELGVYYGLDGVGTRIWELLSEGKSVEEVADAIAGEYEVERDVIVRDLRALLDELAAKGLVTLDAAP